MAGRKKKNNPRPAPCVELGLCPLRLAGGGLAVAWLQPLACWVGAAESTQPPPPCASAGLLVYNGQKKNTGADFVSFGLVGGRPELR